MASRPPEHRTPAADSLARNRWMIIQIMRILGFGTVLVGILLVRGVLDLAGESDRIVGYVLIAGGLADGFLVPLMLARRWRTPQP